METSHKEETALCGWGPFRPGWLQRFHNPVCLALAVALSNLIHGMMRGGFMPAANAIMEKRFYISNTELSAMNAVDEVASIIALILASHFGAKGHKGKWLAGGVIIYSIGALLFTVPQFAVGPYNYAGREGELTYCLKDNSTCHKSQSNREQGVHDFLYLFMLAQVLMGIGTAPGPVLGPTYIDESVSQKRSPRFLGFIMAAKGFGPLIGAALGAVCLKIWGDVGKVDVSKIEITPEDDRWYGAWWLGFLIAGVLGLFAALPLLAFAKKLPGADQERKDDVDQAFGKRKKRVIPEDQKLKDLPKAILRLFWNPVFVSICLVHICMGFLMSVFAPFLVKILEMLFRISTSDATLVKGFAIVFPLSLGALTGGFIVSKLKLKVLGMLTMSMVLKIIAVFLAPIFFLHCQPAQIVGVNLEYPGASEVQLKDGCHEGCNCASIGYRPVCDTANQVAFYSPCFAGCTEQHNSSSEKMWQDCACLRMGGNATTVVEGLCAKYCPMFPVFIVLFAIMAFTKGLDLPTMQQSFLRSVEFHQRTLALSVSWILSRFLGMIPGAIVFGRLLDLACLFNERDLPKPPSACRSPKRRRGPSRCIRYDIHQVAITFSMYLMSLLLAMMLSLSVGAFLYWKHQKTKSVEPTEDSDQRNAQQTTF